MMTDYIYVDYGSNLPYLQFDMFQIENFKRLLRTFKPERNLLSNNKQDAVAMEISMNFSSIQ